MHIFFLKLETTLGGHTQADAPRSRSGGLHLHHHLLDMFALGLILPILPKPWKVLSTTTPERRADLRSVRHRLGGDAVFLLAGPRRPVGPVGGGRWCCCRISGSRSIMC